MKVDGGMPDAAVVVGDVPDVCRKCSGALLVGYGLAGGGMGSYGICERCDVIYKNLDEIEETDMPNEAEISWAIDFDNESETNGCKRGFATREEAEKELAKLRAAPPDEWSDDLGPNARVRHCRRATMLDVGREPKDLLDHIIEMWDEEGVEPNIREGDMFARWDESMISLRDDGSAQRICEVLLREVKIDAWVLTDEPGGEP